MPEIYQNKRVYVEFEGAGQINRVYVNGNFIGEHTTGPDGLITLTDLPPGVYIVTEIRSPDGYILEMTPQTVELRAGHTSRLEFRNTSIPGLKLIKLCSETSQPIEGAVFNVTQLAGNFQRSLGAYDISPILGVYSAVLSHDNIVVAILYNLLFESVSHGII